MAVSDIVSPRIAPVVPSVIQPQPTHYGVITAEAAGPPLTRSVLWDTGVASTLTADALADFNLDVIEDADTAVIDAWLGKVAIKIAPGGATSTDSAGGTSREFTGTVYAVYMRTPIQSAPGSGNNYLVLQIAPGLFIEGRVTEFALVTDQ